MYDHWSPVPGSDLEDTCLNVKQAIHYLFNVCRIFPRFQQTQIGGSHRVHATLNSYSRFLLPFSDAVFVCEIVHQDILLKALLLMDKGTR